MPRPTRLVQNTEIVVTTAVALVEEAKLPKRNHQVPKASVLSNYFVPFIV